MQELSSLNLSSPLASLAGIYRPSSLACRTQQPSSKRAATEQHPSSTRTAAERQPSSNRAVTEQQPSSTTERLSSSDRAATEQRPSSDRAATEQRPSSDRAATEQRLSGDRAAAERQPCAYNRCTDRSRAVNTMSGVCTAPPFLCVLGVCQCHGSASWVALYIPSRWGEYCLLFTFACVGSEYVYIFSDFIIDFETACSEQLRSKRG